MKAREPEKSAAKVVIAVIIVVLLLGGLGVYYFVLAPRFSIVEWSHDNTPLPVSITDWKYGFTVTVKNAGVLGGATTIVCDFAYTNATQVTYSFEGELRVSLNSGEQGDFEINVLLPWDDAVLSTLTQNKSWSVHLS